MLSNAYFLAKLRPDTAENEPAKNLQKISKKSGLLQTQVFAVQDTVWNDLVSSGFRFAGTYLYAAGARGPKG